MTGKIIKGIAGFYYVHIMGQGIYECKARGIFRKDGIKPLVGDNVDIEITSEDDKEGNIINIHDRENSLIRPEVANVSQALIIFAVKTPNPNFNLLDRFLMMMEYEKLNVNICFNKIDLCDKSYLNELEDMYSLAGYDCIFTSVKKNTGIVKLQSVLRGKTTVVAGPSGVGKSSLINMLQSDVTMQTGELSKKAGRGRHTTRHSEIIALDNEGSYIIDTPGFSAINVPDITKEDVGLLYPEIRSCMSKCYFTTCAHISEPNCEVLKRLEEGAINEVRYNNYVKIYEEIADRSR